MPCPPATRYAEAIDFAGFWCLNEPLDLDEEVAINRHLDLAASVIDSARASVDGLTCALASWATEYLKWLNCMTAVVMYNCSCGNAELTDNQRAIYMRWVTSELNDIRTGRKELCDSATGSAYPAVDWAEMTVTEFNAAIILANTMLRTAP
jgi:hypothetical protein